MIPIIQGKPWIRLSRALVRQLVRGADLTAAAHPWSLLGGGRSATTLTSRTHGITLRGQLRHPDE